MRGTRDIGQALDTLVGGLLALRHVGGFDEPNLDGTPGDYVTFEAWEWPQGVGLYGLVQLWRQRDRDPQLGRVIEGWYDRHIAAGLPRMNVNTTAPMLALSLYWRETGVDRFAPVLDDWAGRVLREAPRTEAGGFQHDVSDRLNPGELWDDTLFMMALFLASYGQGAGRRDLVDEAVRQFLVHAHYLACRETGLWFHGWTFDGRHNFARARWARGNAWITAGILDLFDLAEIDPGARAFLTTVLTQQVEALLALQTESGAWRTLLDDPQSYEEISATAGFAYGLLKGARLGIGDAHWAEAGLRGLRAVIDNIDAAGVVRNVSYGTRMGHDLQFYREIPMQPTGYGQSLAILALGEGMRHVSDGETSS